MSIEYRLRPSPSPPHTEAWNALSKPALGALIKAGDIDPQPTTRDMIGDWSQLSGAAVDALTVSDAPTAADQLLAAAEDSDQLRPDIKLWAEQELHAALGSWKRYGSLLEVTPPQTLPELARHTPDLTATLTRLYAAKAALTKSGIRTPGGANIGETMHLVAIPWGAIGRNLSRFDGWLHEMRQQQPGNDADDFFDARLLNAIKSGRPLYRNPDSSGTDLTPTAYLSRRYRQTGPWGLMLAQTTADIGDADLAGKSPDALNDWGQNTVVYDPGGAEIPLDGMGVFEWLALTLQLNPAHLSSRARSWLLASRITMPQSGQQFMPIGARGDNRTVTYLESPSQSNPRIQFRFAIV